jgi:spore coat polysaccharide biosynthesis protein SpsF
VSAPVLLRPAAPTDCEALWRWRNDPATRRASFQQDEIPLDAHTRWFAESLGRPDRRIYIVVVNDLNAGAVRLDLDRDEARVSINLAPEWRGQGIGTRALRLLCREVCGSPELERLSAQVRPENHASRVAFERAGFSVIAAQEHLLLVRPTRLRVVAAIQARMGSSRLPGKALLPIRGRSSVEWIAERLRHCRELETVVVSTSVEPENNAIADLAARIGLDCVRGSEMDLVQRLALTAAVTGAEALVRITADCPLVDPQLVDDVVATWRRSRGELEYVCNVFPPTFPDGLDVELLSRDVLERLDREVADPFFRESLTAYIREHSATFRWDNRPCDENLIHHRWTLDYREDLEFMEAVLQELGPERTDFAMRDVLALLERRPELSEKNRHRGDNVVIRGIRGAAYHAARPQDCTTGRP